MAVTLAELKANIRTIIVPYHDDMEVTVKYRPSRLTPQSASETAIKIEEGAAKNIIVETLVKAIVEWDIVGEDGNMYPITAESMAMLDGALLVAITEAIGEDSRPKKKSAGRSFAR